MGRLFSLEGMTRGHAKPERGEQLWCRWRPNTINYNGLARSGEARRRLRRNICEEHVRSRFTRASTFDEKPCAFLRILFLRAHTPIPKFVSCGGLARRRQKWLMKGNQMIFHEIQQRIAKLRFPEGRKNEQHDALLNTKRCPRVAASPRRCLMRILVHFV